MPYLIGGGGGGGRGIELLQGQQLGLGLGIGLVTEEPGALLPSLERLVTRIFFFSDMGRKVIQRSQRGIRKD